MEEKKRNRKRKEKENRRSTILKAARKLFLERGFKAVTVDSIAEKAEVSKGSIYLCFESKEEIYTQILIADNISLNERIQNFSLIEASASQLLLEFARIYVDFFLSDKELFRILMTFMMQTGQMHLTQQQSDELIRSTNENIKVISEIIQKGVDSGEFRPLDNILQMQNAIWGMLNGVISLFLFTGNPIKRMERIHSTVQESMNVFIRGLKA
ncbi:MAG TPA: TetR/AcrR family transcriptional regulator [Smithella sp.]|nr:TetR/AcrR family transcriptional regulator [Smithella sp.]NMC97519.1 TetR/AcrR family transcriptional regulator [Deltaproteobacteria bacterium]OQC51100.1 MAG: HTH-type transcriptional repressor NicS [Deltaproteobacteria bacterium ADurb.Bin022]HNQ64450.1 TetR/AcrR family transcriptional regulator [Smithella sp.]HOE32526.1 TetR/AcrR family transcriptional regulator [Smithella sp.]